MTASLKVSNGLPVLVVDDDPQMRVALTESLKLLGYATQTATSGEEALDCLNEKQVGAILTDMKMGGISGMDLFHSVSKRQLKIPVIIMSAYGTIDNAVTAIKSGVVDYLVKPFSQERLEEVIRKSLSFATGPSSARPSGRDDSGSAGKLEALLGASGKVRPTHTQRVILTKDTGMLKLLKMAEVVASSDATIFIEGESGTGKELLARFIHECSPRAHRPFIAINCAAVPENLLESELFGHEKGAFTGAITRKPGKFELAHMGTILLDEVSEMQLSLQAKLLRVLQEKEVDSVGGREPIPLDIRVIATTNRPILKEVEAGRFREDLYYRLNVFPLRIPPLRHRIADIPLLAEHFVKKVANRNHKEPPTISKEALSQLLAQPWRGNVREMENTMERATLLAQDGIIASEQLLFTETTQAKKETVTQNGPSVSGEKITLWEAERNLILGTLEKMGGNRTHAAKSLGISIRTLRNKLREYRSSSPSFLGEEGEEGMEGEGEEAIGKNFPAVGQKGH